MFSSIQFLRFSAEFGVSAQLPRRRDWFWWRDLRKVSFCDLHGCSWALEAFHVAGRLWECASRGQQSACWRLNWHCGSERDVIAVRSLPLFSPHGCEIQKGERSTAYVPFIFHPSVFAFFHLFLQVSSYRSSGWYKVAIRCSPCRGSDPGTLSEALDGKKIRI